MEAFVQEVVAKLQQQLQSPLFVPVVGSLAALLFAIVTLYSLAAAQKKNTKSVQGGTIITEQGLRRSTRQHKAPQPKYTPEKASPPPAKTPRAAKTPRTSKKAEAEAVTVTPKVAKPRTSRAAAKTPATVEPATTRTRRAAAKTPAK